MDDQERAETREVVFGVLRLIANPEAQLEFECESPIANVPAELVEQWFSDHYHPEAEWFQEAFTAAERTVMGKFNAFYSDRVDRLPSAGRVADLLRNSDWRDISEAARIALQNLPE